ncbi:DUF4296 domain-containing protein [Chryseobacterium lactis]|uniref:DUF4296 domain-containing protein n=1 Tax=Chryseobacterium lactis TaxID=1241981 RepID=A0A3G6RXT5_CHRLC|nr:DUF4296 domain-containing protein [Chryseobacterium lactis]AZA81618.1 DUF4296 domain-containing protein [Chryseobacterium lactis]AZB06616.1 DUF4296 domain-containing protein [Chryseobacterium lactis]PNW15467.1 DUF4296 domain-containing protein [Chryseobacterium lactis]
MKKLIFIFVLLGLFSCSDFIDKPKNLIDENVMAEVIADLMLNEQATFMYQNKNMEAGTRFILKSHHVKPDDFVESFKYYIIKEKMEGITNDAQAILLKKDSKAAKYVKDKANQNGNPAPLVR